MVFRFFCHVEIRVEFQVPFLAPAGSLLALFKNQTAAVESGYSTMIKFQDNLGRENLETPIILTLIMRECFPFSRDTRANPYRVKAQPWSINGPYRSI